VNSLPNKKMVPTYVNNSFPGKIYFRLKAFLIGVVEERDLHGKNLILEKMQQNNHILHDDIC